MTTPRSRRTTLSILVLTALAGGTIARAEDEPRSDSHPLQGIWVANPDDETEGAWVFEGDKVTVTVPNAKYVARVSADAKSDPGHVDFQVEEGPEEAVTKTVRGIYQREGKSLTVAVARPGGDRPERLEAVPDAIYLFKLTRKADRSSPETRRALETMSGTWVNRLHDGDAVWEFRGSRLRVTAPRRQYESTIQLDPDAKPFPSITFYIVNGPPDAKGRTSLGIYKFEDEKLVIGVDGGTGVAPTQFVTDGSKSFVFELSRK